jgi:glyoxylase-like metal-dependent hydrolase (beta-lactamase superfamily II)
MARLYLRQLLAGRDFALEDPVAGQMQNFVYLVGDRDTGECLVIDPAWDVRDLVRVAEADGLRIVGALATHYHPDHVGGTMFGFTVEGLPTLMQVNPCPVHVHRLEGEGVRKVTGLSRSDLVEHDSGDRVKVGDIEVELLHTPGHTPGSCCFRLDKALLAGDTLFLQGCGRVDLPGGDPDEMYRTLTQRLSALPDDTVLLPGHAYGGESAPLGHVRRTNPYLGVKDLATWRRAMGGR